MIEGKLFFFPEPQFPHRQNSANSIFVKDAIYDLMKYPRKGPSTKSGPQNAANKCRFP